MKSIIITLICLITININLNSQNTATTKNGDWTNGGNWSNGTPGWAVSASITNDMNLNTSISIGNGSNHVVDGGSITDLPGGARYNISFNGNGSLEVNDGSVSIEGNVQISNDGSIIVDGNFNVDGDFNISNNGSLSIKGCDTLRIGGNVRFSNNSTVTIDECAVLIVDGNVNMNNNNANTINGNMVVKGNLRATNRANVNGNGNIQIDGEVNLNNQSNLFGSSDGCGGSCSYGAGAGLPIELNFFKAHLNSDDLIEAYWETATEINNDYFTIEVSANGVDYRAVEQILGAGNNNTTLSYKSIIKPLNAEVNYIRLKQTDFNGTFKYFKPVAIEINSAKNLKRESDFSIYPNPGNGSNLTAELNPSHTGEYTVQLIDSKGSVLATKQFYSNNEGFSERFELLNGLQLKSGIYFVRAHNAEETLTLKYMVQ